MIEKSRSLGVNAILNAVRSGLSVLFPLITYPYALRVLGAESIGRVSFGNSIISYFVLLAGLGVSTYAVREGVKLKNNRTDFSMFVSEMFSINLISTVLAYFILGLYLISSVEIKQYRSLIMLQSLSIVLTTVGMDWINVIHEDYFMMTIRSIATYLISAAILFLTVRGPEDYIRYASLIVLSNGIVCTTNLFYIRRYASVSFLWTKNMMSHLKPMLVFFFNTAAIAVYVNIDVTMLGFMKGEQSTGLYTAAVRVYTVLKNIFIALYTVSLPRLIRYAGEADKNTYKKILTDVVNSISLLLIPVGIGTAFLSREIMVLIGGIQFEAAGTALKILSISLMVAVFGGIMTALHNIAVKKEKINLKATIYSAGLNLILNTYFISRFDFAGAAFTTLLSEVFVLVYCLWKEPEYRRYIETGCIVREVGNAFMASVLFVIFIFAIRDIDLKVELKLIISILGSIMIYSGYMILVKDRYVMYFFKKVFHRFR